VSVIRQSVGYRRANEEADFGDSPVLHRFDTKLSRGTAPLPITKKDAVTKCIDFVHQRDTAFAKFDAYLDPATNQVETNATSAVDEQHALFLFKKCMAEQNIRQ
jgi:hypothetical protein